MVTARSNRKMWFGTKDYADFIETPRQGADVSPVAWGASGTTLNGSGYAFNSYNSHKEYQFSWGSVAAREAAQTMKSYFDGSFGRGKLYFQDPLTYDTNVLPARWADPSITADFEGPQLVPGVDPTTTPTSNFQYLKLPVRTAVFDLSGTQPVTGTTFVPEAENLFTNPNLVGSGSWTEVARNVIPNPLMSNAGTVEGWGRTSAAQAFPSWSIDRLVWEPTASGTGLFINVGSQPAGAFSVKLLAGLLSGGGFYIRISEGAITSVVAESVRFTSVGEHAVTVSGTLAGVGDTYVSIYSSGVGGSSLTLREVTSAGVAFSGSSEAGSINPDMRQRWLGAVNASESVMEIETVRGFVGARTIVGLSTDNGIPAVRLISTGGDPTQTSYASIIGGVPVEARNPGTFVAAISAEEPSQGGVGSINGLRAANPQQLATTPSSFTGTQDLRISIVGNDGTQAALYGDGAASMRELKFSKIGLFAGSYDGPWFAGDSEIPGKVTRWTGAPNNSTSQIGHLIPTSTPTLNDDNSVFVPIPDGMQLNIGAFYTATSNNSGVFVSNATQGGGVGSSLTRLNQVPSNTTNLTPNVITKAPGDIGVYVWIGKTAAGNQTVSLTAIHARLSPIGEAPKGEHRWLGGQGNAGVRFTQPPTYINHTGVNGGQVEFAATFKESIL